MNQQGFGRIISVKKLRYKLWSMIKWDLFQLLIVNESLEVYALRKDSRHILILSEA